MSSENLDESLDIDEVDRIAHAFINYKYDTINKNSYPQKLLSEVKSKQNHKFIKSGMNDYYNKLQNCAEVNQNVLQNILKFNLAAFHDSEDVPEEAKIRTLRNDNYRITQMLSGIEREWSLSGKAKRDQM